MQLTLLDTSSGADTIPSLRLTLSDVSLMHVADAHASVPSCLSSRAVGMSSSTKFSLDIQAAVEVLTGRSCLDVEEALISVRSTVRELRLGCRAALCLDWIACQAERLKIYAACSCIARASFEMP